MKAVWYERTGAAADVLTYGDMPTPVGGAGEVRVRLEASGVNPADVGRRAGSYRAMEYPRVIPNSDGAGIIDQQFYAETLNLDNNLIYANGTLAISIIGQAAVSIINNTIDQTTGDDIDILKIPTPKWHELQSSLPKSSFARPVFSW